MRVRHRGFALILVLLAAAAVFALAMHSAVVFRAATVESRVMVERAGTERDARSAAAMVLIGLGTTVERYASQTGGSAASSPGTSGEPGAPAEEEKPRIELPPMLREMLGELGEEIEEKAEESQDFNRAADGGGVTGNVDGRRRLGSVKLAAFPAAPVPVQPNRDGPVYLVTISDGAALLNVSLAPRDQLERYFRAKSIESELAAQITSQIIDWRDEDDFAEPAGAEQSRYTPRGITCRNGPLEAVEELLFLPAMTSELFRLIRSDLTVAGDAKVHAGTASREVLLSLPDMTEESVTVLLQARAAGPLTKEIVEAALPLYARQSVENLRFDPSSVLRIRVTLAGETSISFEGIAVLSDRGGIRALGLRPIF